MPGMGVLCSFALFLDLLGGTEVLVGQDWSDGEARDVTRLI